jgi:hypothetical protein
MMTSYRHYKGGTYTLLFTARLSEQRDVEVAVYVSHARDTIWVRPLEMFREDVLWPDGVMRPRFTPLGQAPADLDFEDNSSQS